MDGSPKRLLPSAPTDTPTMGAQFQTALQAIKTGEDEELDNINDEINNNLINELSKDVVEAAIGWGPGGPTPWLTTSISGVFSSNNRNHTWGGNFAPFPDSYFERLTRYIERRFDRFDDEAPVLPAHDPPALPANL
ncbi:hypothetical protein EDB89DRAFT_2083261 [Lactarius sanguifluus]|nr:hypothetical protein EDB89DRAFT_2083261 [Lactarius sanguifluus]